MLARTLPISCIIVNLNESLRLDACLASVSFCDEIIFIDLGSTDNSVAIAQKYGCTVVHHPKVPIGEMARHAYVAKAKYDWILCADPDEVLDASLVAEIAERFPQANGSVASFAFPWQFYFKENQLTGTVWGDYQRKKSVLHHRGKVLFPDQVHTVHQMKDGYREIVLDRKGSNVIHHYWCNGFREFMRKHNRYLKLEGAARHGKGQKYSVKNQVEETAKAFASCFYFTKGYRDGLAGITLSLLYTWYVFMSWNSLRNFERKNAR